MQSTDKKNRDAIHIIKLSDVARLVPKRQADTSKGDYGRLLIIAGSKGMYGCAYLCAKGAFRSGAGLVYTAGPEEMADVLCTLLPEVIFFARPTGTIRGNHCARRTNPEDQIKRIITASRPDSIVIGPGITSSYTAARILEYVLTETEQNLVLDADALNIIAACESNLLLLKSAAKEKSIIITPHPGEMARLMLKSIAEVQGDRIKCAREFSDKFGTITVLKGHNTVIARPGGRADDVSINPTGNAGMATAGSGDVLAGIIGSFLAQGLKPWDAAVLGTYIHGMAGDLAAKELSMHGMMASDIIEYLPEAFRKLQKKGNSIGI